MIFEWDDKKAATNVVKHKLEFSSVEAFAWHEAVVFERSHVDDGERRYAAVGMLYGKLYTVIFTKREPYTRIISLRRANKSEEKAYEENY